MTEEAMATLPMKAKSFHIAGFEIFFYLQLENNLVSVMISATAISISDIILIYHNFLKISLIKRVKGSL